jgi:hypothetical protein
MTDLPPPPTITAAALVDQRLTPVAFHALAGRLGGHEYVKVVVERESGRVHFINERRYRFHSDYVGEQILGVSGESIDLAIDRFNESVYLSPERRFYIASLTLHEASRGAKAFFAIETVEIDTMGADMILDMMRAVGRWLDPAFVLVFKPANHLQERIVAGLSPEALPRVLIHELFSAATYLPLNPGRAVGRIRAFASIPAYRDARSTLRWSDILVMPRVPDDVPRVSGLVNAERTTPLSHPNVLAHGWGIPNAIQIGILERVAEEGLDGRWVRYEVDPDASAVTLVPVDPPASSERPPWSSNAVRVAAPVTTDARIEPLGAIRATDRDRFGTKAANLGELQHVLARGSDRLLGFYRIQRPPRESLLPHLAARLGVAGDGAVPEEAALEQAALEYLRREVHTLRGVALPFALSRTFFESSPAVQRGIGRLQMALELGALQAEAAALEVARTIRAARMPSALRDDIDGAVARHLGGARSFVVRSSSNAEDLEGFSAAGVYESVTHVTTAERLFESIKTVWASLFSPRSVRLRAEVGIPLEDACMGVIVQEEMATPDSMGGVLVTSNPTAPGDFRDVYLNVSLRSVSEVVAGLDASVQMLCNTVEGGSHTLSIGEASAVLDAGRVETLERLALAGRLLQSHFASDYTFATPLDIEWVWSGGRTYLLQVRPYAG